MGVRLDFFGSVITHPPQGEGVKRALEELLAFQPKQLEPEADREELARLIHQFTREFRHAEKGLGGRDSLLQQAHATFAEVQANVNERLIQLFGVPTLIGQRKTPPLLPIEDYFPAARILCEQALMQIKAQGMEWPAVEHCLELLQAPFSLENGEELFVGAFLIREYSAWHGLKKWERWQFATQKKPKNLDVVTPMIKHAAKWLDFKLVCQLVSTRRTCDSDLGRNDEPAGTVHATTVAWPDGFDPSDDFRTVTYKGDLYHLTPPQAAVIRVLAEAWHRLGWVAKERLLEASRSTGDRLRDVFKSNSSAYKALVVGGGNDPASKGKYRLNVPPRPVAGGATPMRLSGKSI